MAIYFKLLWAFYYKYFLPKSNWSFLINYFTSFKTSKLPPSTLTLSTPIFLFSELFLEFSYSAVTLGDCNTFFVSCEIYVYLFLITSIYW